jgi:hypothetical protein
MEMHYSPMAGAGMAGTQSTACLLMPSHAYGDDLSSMLNTVHSPADIPRSLPHPLPAPETMEKATARRYEHAPSPGQDRGGATQNTAGWSREHAEAGGSKAPFTEGPPGTPVQRPDCGLEAAAVPGTRGAS